jgi:hypothetical protein
LITRKTNAPVAEQSILIRRGLLSLSRPGTGYLVVVSQSHA